MFIISKMINASIDFNILKIIDGIFISTSSILEVLLTHTLCRTTILSSITKYRILWDGCVMLPAPTI